MTTFNVVVNVNELLYLNDDLNNLIKNMDVAIIDAVNTTAKNAKRLSTNKIIEEINLNRDYVESKLSIENATTQNQSAFVIASDNDVLLNKYNPVQMVIQTKSGKGKGDVLRGIKAGYKQAGVKVSVKNPSNSRPMKNAFLMPLKGSGDMGVFARLPTGKVKVLYGVSVHQAFKNVARDLLPTFQDNLEYLIIKYLGEVKI